MTTKRHGRSSKTRVDPEVWKRWEAWLGNLVPTALPPEPWVLRATPAARSMSPTGGDFVRVINNENYLHHLRRDMSEGPEGPRGHVVLQDLEDLGFALERYQREGPQ